MDNKIFRDQVLVLGLIDYLFDILENEGDRKETRNNLLAAVQATFANKLLENPETSNVVKPVLQNIPQGSGFENILGSTQKLAQDLKTNVDFASFFRESAKEVLNEFVTQAQKPELSSQINDLFQ